MTAPHGPELRLSAALDLQNALNARRLEHHRATGPVGGPLSDGDVVVLCPRCRGSWDLDSCEIRDEPDRRVYRCPTDRALFVIVWSDGAGGIARIEKRVDLFYVGPPDGTPAGL